MPKEPTQAIFACESCGRSSTADARMAAHLLPFKRKLPIQGNGLCRHCGGNRWTITAVFSETGIDVAESAVGLGLAVATGHGFVQHSTASNCFAYPGVPASLVAQLNESPAERLGRVGEFVRTMERAKAKEQGARECLACGALFVQTKGQAWNEAGYCSKLCQVQAQGVSSVATSPAAGGAAPRKANTIRVRCELGHLFDVAVSFAGMIRPCPQCGKKTPVVEAPLAGPDDIPARGSEERVLGQDGENLARALVAAIQGDGFRDRIFNFDADGDLSAAERVKAFRQFEQLVKSQEWAPKFASIDVVSGIEDYVAVYFFGSQRMWLVLSAGYHYDVKQWKLDAYETADRSFARPEGESFEDYVVQNIRDVKAAGRPYSRHTTLKDGSYYMEY